MNWSDVRQKLKVGEEVKVLWVDANTTHDWFDIDDEYCDHEKFVESSGHILRLDERFIVIYSTRGLSCDDNKDVEEYCLTMKVPAGCIKKIYFEPDWGEPIELS